MPHNFSDIPVGPNTPHIAHQLTQEGSPPPELPPESVDSAEPSTPPRGKPAPSTQSEFTPLKPSSTFSVGDPEPPLGTTTMPAAERNLRYGRELAKSRKVLGPMPPRLFLDTFLPQRSNQPPHEKNMFFGLVYSSDKNLLDDMVRHFAMSAHAGSNHSLLVKIKGCSSLAFSDLANTMNITPEQKIFGVRDRADAVTGSLDGSLCYRTLSSVVEFKPPGADYNIANDDAEKPEEFLKVSDRARRCLGQMGKYAVHSFAFRYREFLFTVYIRGLQTRLLRWDSSGVIITKEFDLSKEDHLSVFYHRFFQASPSEQGFDQTVEDVTETIHYSEYSEARDALVKWSRKLPHIDRPLLSKELHAEAVKKGHLRWLVVEVPSLASEDGGSVKILCRDLHQGASDVFGRGTRALPGAILSLPGVSPTSSKTTTAQDMTLNQIVLVKDSWRPQGAAKEWETIQELNQKGVPHVPTVLAGGELMINERVRQTQTPDFLSSEWNICKDAALDFKVHQRFVQKQIGIPLSRYRTPRDIFTAIYYAVLAHQSAYNNGWLHRDISDGNVLIYPTTDNSTSDEEEEEEKWVGILIDWEYARPLAATAASQRERTGTYSFMSRRLLAGDSSYVQNVTDDLESFFWVVVYNCLRYVQSEVDNRELSQFLWKCFHKDWERSPVTGKVTGGFARTHFVTRRGAIDNTGPVQWTFQAPIADWVRDMTDALHNLSYRQDQLDAAATLQTKDPHLTSLDRVRPKDVLARYGFSSKTALLSHLEIPLSKRYVFDNCDMADHDWFLRTLKEALHGSGEEGDIVPQWNKRAFLVGGGEVCKREKALDYWIYHDTESPPPTHVSDASDHPAVPTRSHQSTAMEGSSQPPSGNGEKGSANEERPPKRRKPNAPT